MAGTGAPWQLELEMVEQRCGYLLTSGQLSDCTFVVGSGINQKAFLAHKLVLAMASPVFERMFYRRLLEPNEPIVTVPDVQPEAFKAMLQYLNGLEKRLDAVEQERAARLDEPAPPAAVIGKLQNTVAHLQQELNDRDREALMADLEIGQLPEEKGENVLHSITVLAAKLGVQLDERDVVFAERVGVAQVEGAGGDKPRARRIVVRLLRRDLRDRMLQGARVRRSLTAVDAGRADTGPRIFVNERLSRLNRQLFHRAREECRRLQWRYTWTKRGRVFVRQADGRDAYPIRCEADIQRVFG